VERYLGLGIRATLSLLWLKQVSHAYVTCYEDRISGMAWNWFK